MEPRRGSTTAFFVVVIVIIAVLIITAGLRNSTRPWQNRKNNITALAHQRGRSSLFMMSSINRGLSNRSNKTLNGFVPNSKIKQSSWHKRNNATSLTLHQRGRSSGLASINRSSSNRNNKTLTGTGLKGKIKQPKNTG